MKKPLETPLLPQGKATVAVSKNAVKVISALKRTNTEVFEIPENQKLEPSISSHADCNILQLDRNTFITDKTSALLLSDLFKMNNIVNYLTIGQEKENLFFSRNAEKVNIIVEEISSPYPDEVKINVKKTEKAVVCNTKYVSEIIKAYAENYGFDLIHSNQGYVGCSSVLISDNAVMTDDESVYSAFCRIGFDCLMLSKGQIKLSGHSYGFIGGACGFIDKKLIAFTGRLNTHNDAEIIKAFLNKYNVDYVELTDEPLTDVGGIVPILEEI